MKLIKKENVLVVDYGLLKFPVGRIKQDTLYLDSPSRHKMSKSYGIDTIVLQSHAMDYHYIDVLVGKEHWITSRLFWYNHGRRYNLRNGRDELFLEDRLFGADKAIKYEKYLKNAEIAQMSIFDVLTDPNPQALPNFEAALQAQEEYRESVQQKDRKITL